MKSTVSTLIVCSFVLSGMAQDVSVTFTARGAADRIDSIIATNLTTDLLVSFPGDATLVLTAYSGINMPGDLAEEVSIYPVPFEEATTLKVVVPSRQIVEIHILNVNGQRMALSRTELSPGFHEFTLAVSKAGIYTVLIVTAEGGVSSKILATRSKGGACRIQYKGINQGSLKSRIVQPLKSTGSSYELGYAKGDVIQYQCFSGDYTTILSDTLPISRNLPVVFESCQDESGKNYPIVQIGGQTWMAANLAYLPAIYPGTEGSDTDPYYYVPGYQGSDLNQAVGQATYRLYGALYNWEAARVSCPAGWHLPSDDEWKTMEIHLGMSQEEADGTDPRNSGEVGKKLKSSKGWEANGNGSNSSGFTAVPGGIRNEDGAFYYIGSSSYFWTSSMADEFKAWGRCLHFYDDGQKRGNTYRRIGFAVRCVKNT